jgi:hypothetical protein
MPTHPTAFISCSWDDEAHKEWVKQLATQLRHDGVDARLDHWHAVPGDQLPEFMEREIRENDFVIIICTPKYKEKSDKRAGGVGYEGDIMTAEVLTKQTRRKFIPVLAKGSWAEAAPSWLLGTYHVDLSDVYRYPGGYQDLLTTILSTRPKPPPLGPLPPGYKSSVHSPPGAPVSSVSHDVNLQLYDRRLPIYEAAVRLIYHIVTKGTCTQEELNLFVRDTKQARHLFDHEIESYLQRLSTEALYVLMGEQKRKALAATSDEYRESMEAWSERMMWFAEQSDKQFSEVKRRFDPFLRISL